LALGTLSVLLAACGATSAPASRHSLVTGSVMGYGGPIRIVKGKVVDHKPWSIAGMAVVVTGTGATRTFRVRTNAAGRFAIELPTGTYAIAAGCEPGRTQALHVRAGRPLVVHLACDYP
jgi:hypothetical protein